MNSWTISIDWNVNDEDVLANYRQLVANDFLELVFLENGFSRLRIVL